MVEIIQYSGHSGVPMVGSAGTWAEVLALGNETLGNTPVVSDGDGLHLEGDNSITVDNTLDIDVGIDLNIGAGGALDLTAGGDYFATVGAIFSLFADGDVEIFSNNGTLWLDAGDPGDPSGLIRLEAPAIEVNSPDLLFASDMGTVSINLDDVASGAAPQMRIVGSTSLGNTVGSTGGNVELRAGDGGPNAIGGGLLLSPGGGNTNGSINITSGTGTTMILIDGDNVPIGGSQAIHITTAGIALWDGTPSMRPEVIGSRGGNAALADLLTVLDAAGYITDNTTA